MTIFLRSCGITLIVILLFIVNVTRLNYKQAEETNQMNRLFNKLAVNRLEGIRDPYLEEEVRQFLIYPR